MTDRTPSTDSEMLVGTYTETLPHVVGKADGILSIDVGETRPSVGGKMLAAVRNPSWLAISADGQNVYAVVETVEFEGAPGGGVVAFHRSSTSGTLTLLNTAPSGGVEPAHLALDPTEKFVLVANYRSGSVAVFAREADGALGTMVDHVQHAGSSSHPVRQTGPHAHQILFDPVTDNVLVPDLGVDAVLNYRLTDGKLTENATARIDVTPGAGPRHLAFDPTGRHLFLLNELDNTLEVYERTDDRFSLRSRVSTLPDEFTGHSQGAAVRVSHSGRYVFTSNRGLDSIAMFSFDASASTVSLVHLEPSRGREPRDFIQSRDGRRLFVANQDTDTIETFLVDEDVASLEHLSSVEVPTPVCLVLTP
jgi:6-phosphogluconolactonase